MERYARHGTIGRCNGAVALGLALVLSHSNIAVADDDTAMARVASGSLRGAVTSGIAAFKGIPYAAPPVGDLRWRAPAPALSWSGVRDASDYGASCEQSPAPRFVREDSRAATVSEDCLSLNVWTPAIHAARLPVMVWLHGGGGLYGTGSTTVFDGSTFARDGVVLVTVNYRLGLFGFFAHPALAAGSAQAAGGNFALLDQIAALRWVQTNIAAFGGDASNVTLFGESEGGRDTVLLATTERAKGLFSRAIAESPNALWVPLPSRAEAQAHGAVLAADLGLPSGGATAEELRAVPADALAVLANRDRIGPIADGSLIGGPASTAFEGAPHVPIVIGTNDDDGIVGGPFSDPDSVFPTLSRDDVATIRAKYLARGTSGDASVARKLYGDGAFAAPARWVAARTAAAGRSAYLYRFSYVAKALAARGVVSAPHGSEVAYVFGRAAGGTDLAVATAMHACWIAFAKGLAPACVGGSPWTPFDPAHPRYMVFDATPSMRDPIDDDVMDVLERALLPSEPGGPAP